MDEDLDISRIKQEETDDYNSYQAPSIDMNCDIKEEHERSDFEHYDIAPVEDTTHQDYSKYSQSEIGLEPIKVEPEDCAVKDTMENSSLLDSIKLHANRVVERTELSDHQKAVLQEAWIAGLQSTSREKTREISDLALKTGLSVTTVKNFIGNYRRKREGRVYKRNVVHVKGRSAYNQFCADEAKQGNADKKSWAVKWKQLDKEKQDAFKYKAKLPADPQSRSVLISKHLQIIRNHIDHLASVGVNIMLMAVDEDSSYSVGTPDGIKYINHTNVMQNFKDFLGLKRLGEPTKLSHQELVKKVQELMNAKYATLAGQMRAFPYQLCQQGGLVVDGFPAECLPVRPPSCYGTEKLSRIISRGEYIKMAWPKPRR